MSASETRSSREEIAQHREATSAAAAVDPHSWTALVAQAHRERTEAPEASVPATAATAVPAPNPDSPAPSRAAAAVAGAQVRPGSRAELEQEAGSL